MNKGFRYLEAFVIALLIVIAVCFLLVQIVAGSAAGCRRAPGASFRRPKS